MNDMERLEECLTCIKLDGCNIDADDKDGHCVEYVQDDRWKKKLEHLDDIYRATSETIDAMNKLSADGYEQGKTEVIEKLKELEWYSIHNGKLINGAEGDEALIRWKDVEELIKNLGREV